MALGVRWVTVAVLLLVVPACNSKAPPSGPEAICAQACQARVHDCDSAACGRGCNLVLDRLAEGEGEHVIACVAKNKDHACNDRTWAYCAARVGIHADGGPPPPAAPSDEEDED
jgi:hypothetical protein